jgi:hypothetical protein
MFELFLSQQTTSPFSFGIDGWVTPFSASRKRKSSRAPNSKPHFWNRDGADVFVGMNPVKDGAYSRTKQSLKEIRHVYLDIDRNGDQAIELIRSSLEVPTPNFVLNTSPGKYQVVWRIEGASLQQAESLLHGMAGHFGGDFAATDASRVLRLPGFVNHKLAFEFVVQVVQASDAVYSLRDFSLPDESLEAPRRHSESYGSHRSPGHRSQSERDWGYAKRALARGDDPEDVIRRIADYRGDEKHSTYARRTVEKAQADLKNESFRHPGPQATDIVQSEAHRSDKSSPVRR